MLESLKLRGQTSTWPSEYRNSDTGRTYKPHHSEEYKAVYEDVPRYVLLKGGEGGGKSVAGIVKTLNRIKRGMSGIMVSPDLQHFKRSLWPEFRRWCPWDQVVAKHRYRGNFVWEPQRPFALAFLNGSVLYCGGIDDPIAWEGPNVNFAHLDEARRKRKADALKVLDGRVRIPGPQGEPPQMWITTTPKKNWLFEFFGPVTARDPRAKFKERTLVVTLLTKDNEPNLEEDFVEKRALTLTSAERRVYLDAEWEDLDDIVRYLDDMILWDRCLARPALPVLSPYEPLVLALDAGISHAAFGLIGMTRHPDRHDDAVAVRIARAWLPPVGGKIDFQGTEDAPGPEMYVRWLAENYALAIVAYDPWQLHDMGTRLYREHVAWMFPFIQGSRRLEADRQLLDLIISRRLAHDGNALLKEHIDNADRKIYSGVSTSKVRMVQREPSLRIDLAVCTAMAAHECLRLQL